MYFGDSSIKKLYVPEKKSIKTVTIYTQPNQEEAYRPLIEKFISLQNYYKFKLFIRKHPRDTVNLENFNLNYDKSENIESSLENTDLAVSHFSSCLAYAFAKGIPYISFCRNPQHFSNLSFMSDEICLKFDKLENIESIFTNEKDFLKEYYEKRVNYITKYNSKFDIDAYNKAFV